MVGITKDDESRKNNELFTAFTTLKAIYAKGDNVGNIEFSIKNLKTKEDNEKFEANYRASTNLRHRPLESLHLRQSMPGGARDHRPGPSSGDGSGPKRGEGQPARLLLQLLMFTEKWS